MHEDDTLSLIVQDITPSPAANLAMEADLSRVEDALAALDIPSARMGSQARQTRLAEHRVADLAISMDPTDGPLAQLADGLQALLPAAQVRRSRVGLEVAWMDHALDLWPRGPDPDQTADEPRYAALGPGHARWYLEETQGRLTPVILGLKHHRRCVPALQVLPPFALEVLAVTLLGPDHTLPLPTAFAAILAALAQGLLSPGGELDVLPDPVDPEHDLLARVPVAARLDLLRVAARALRAVERDAWSVVFPERRIDAPLGARPPARPPGRRRPSASLPPGVAP